MDRMIKIEVYTYEAEKIEIEVDRDFFLDDGFISDDFVKYLKENKYLYLGPHVNFGF